MIGIKMKLLRKSKKWEEEVLYEVEEMNGNKLEVEMSGSKSYVMAKITSKLNILYNDRETNFTHKR